MVKCKNGKITLAGRRGKVMADFTSLVAGMSRTIPRDELLTLFLMGVFRTEIKEKAGDDAKEHFDSYDEIKKFVVESDELLIKYIRNTKNNGISG